MIEIIKNIFRSFKKEIPEIVQKELLLHFPAALNIDWYPLENMYEAIFYLKDVEHIAKISKEGKLVEYKKNLWVNEVPEQINLTCLRYGEIMSAIVIYSGMDTNYEIIIRNKEQKRNRLLLDSNGNLIDNFPV